MTKTQLIENVAKELGMTKKDVAAVIDAAYNNVCATLSAGEAVQIAGFGIFSVKEKAAHMGRNPRTKEAVEIPACRRISFSASKTLKDKLN